MSENGIRQIVHLLSSTEMAVSEIAERMSCSRSTIISINRRFEVRQYNGLRSSWSKADLVEDFGRCSSPTQAKKKRP
jgi:hypothetical protein